MAVKDFIAYYKEEEAQYNEMLGDAADLEDAFRSGRIDEEKYDSAMKYVEAIKANHERLSYVMFLLTKRKKYERKCVKRAEVGDNAGLLEGLDGLKPKGE